MRDTRPQGRIVMQIYLPIAEVSVNAFLLLGIGGIVGVLSGMFGVGGGFLITPLLFFIGVPPTVAVATGANQVVASSVSGVLAHLRRKTVDFRMGLVLLAGGMIGSAFGIWVEKSMYGRKYMGVERTTALVAADGTVARLWPKVKVPGHAEEVLEAARQLSAAT